MVNNFYLDIYNQIININESKIFIIFDKNGEIWFSYKNLLNSLDYKDAKSSIKYIDINKKYIKEYSNIKVGGMFPPTFNLQPKTKMINNNGLFMLLSLSTKPLAKQFMKKYIDEIMPQITKTGKYISAKEDQKKIVDLNKKIVILRNKVMNLTNENSFLDSKHRFVQSKNGYAYINETTCIINGNKRKCYKFGITNNIERRYKQYLTGNPTYKMLYYVILDIDINILESCLKNISKVHSVKNNHETSYFTSLTQLKEIIINCYKLIKNHICSCIICNKKFKFSNIDNHNCNDKLNFVKFESKKNSKKNSK